MHGVFDGIFLHLKLGTINTDMSLTNTACKQASPKDRDYKLSDEKSLFLLVTKKGAKYWRLNYRFAKKQKTLALGVYPEVSLKEAREKTAAVRKSIDEGKDPSLIKKAQKLSILKAGANSFEVVAWEWFEKEKPSWSAKHIKKQKSLIENNLIPHIGKFPVTEITPLILLDCLRKAEARGVLETANRLKQISGQVFRYAVITGRLDRDPSIDLKDALKTPQAKHYAAITEPKQFGQLLRAIDGYEGTTTVAIALKLAPMLFVRPGELRHMEWEELFFEDKEWRIPGAKMKSRQPHIVPLSKQALRLLEEIFLLTGRWKYVFPGIRSKSRPMSDNSLNAALRRLGYSTDEVTTHGFRATARTMLDEKLDFAPHLIEHQLAHTVKDPLGRAYNRTSHLEQRKEMMQGWADYLEELKVTLNNK